MGVIYVVLPFDARTRDSLAEYGLAPPAAPDGRNPTIAEVRAVLDALAGHRIEYEPVPAAGESWGASITSLVPETGPWTTLRVLRYAGESAPTDIAFHKGWPQVIFTIVAALANECGTLVLWPDTGGAPAVVPPGANLHGLLAQWEDEETGETAG
jgi:hypothetical protein